MSRRYVITWKADSFFPFFFFFFSNDRLFNASHDVELEKQKIRVGFFLKLGMNMDVLRSHPPALLEVPASISRASLEVRVHLRSHSGTIFQVIHLGFVTAEAIMASRQIHNRRRAHQAAARCGRPE